MRNQTAKEKLVCILLGIYKSYPRKVWVAVGLWKKKISRYADRYCVVSY